MTKAPPCPAPPATTRLRGVEAALLPEPASHLQGHRPPYSSPQPAEGKAAGSREGTWGEVWWQGTLEEATGVSWLWPEPPQRTLLRLGAQAAHRLWGCWGGQAGPVGHRGPYVHLVVRALWNHLGRWDLPCFWGLPGCQSLWSAYCVVHPHRVPKEWVIKHGNVRCLP